MIGSAKETNGLYILENSTFNDYATQPQGLSGSVSKPNIDLVMLWHFRLGHPSFSYLQKLFPHLFTNFKLSDFNCEQCILSKSHRTTYVSRPYTPSKPFYLIHSDIWGPSKVNTLSNKRWFVTFIDDHTRVCWVYLMKDKSEVEQIFRNFYAMVETVFGSKISFLRTDNGAEYFKTSLGQFFTEKGIYHQTTCVSTPQQNGIAERKNRHLLEVARAIMFTMHIPKYLWGDALLTSSYLINRMPTRVLNFTSPIESLKLFFPELRMISNLPLKVFGCTAFVHSKNLNLSKLDPRAEKCIFVGYSSTQKGYKCYNPTTKRYFVSMDVTFFEKQHFFPPNSLPGETFVEEGNFWESYVALPKLITDESVLPAPFLPEKVDSSVTYIGHEPESRYLSIPKSTSREDAPLKKFLTYARRKGTVKQPVASLVPVQSSPLGANPGTEHQNCNEFSEFSLPDSSFNEPDPCHESNLDLPIALRKDKRNTYPISQFVSYSNLSKGHNTFLTTLDNLFVPKNIQEALGDPNWKLAVMEEMEALEKNQT